MIYDKISEDRLNEVCPDVAWSWCEVREQFWNEHKLQLRVACGMRTFAQQWAEYGKGRLKDKNGTWIICDIKKVVTYAIPGQSFHQYGLAIDTCFLSDDPYLERMKKDQAIILWNTYGAFCKDSGLEWGGDWGAHADRPHCQNRYGMSWDQAQMIYEDKGIKGVWNKCKNISACGSEII